jgi:hypothetical protein
MDSKSKAGDALRAFCNEFGVPEKLRFTEARSRQGRILNSNAKLESITSNNMYLNQTCTTRAQQKVS